MGIPSWWANQGQPPRLNSANHGRRQGSALPLHPDLVTKERNQACLSASQGRLAPPRGLGVILSASARARAACASRHVSPSSARPSISSCASSISLRSARSDASLASCSAQRVGRQLISPARADRARRGCGHGPAVFQRARRRLVAQLPESRAIHGRRAWCASTACRMSPCPSPCMSSTSRLPRRSGKAGIVQEHRKIADSQACFDTARYRRWPDSWPSSAAAAPAAARNRAASRACRRRAGLGALRRGGAKLGLPLLERLAVVARRSGS